MRSIVILFLGAFTAGCFEPTPAQSGDGTDSDVETDSSMATTGSPTTGPGATDTSPPTDTTSADDADSTATAATTDGPGETGSDTGQDGTETGVMPACQGTPTPCEDFGVGEHDACEGADGCTPVIACDGTPDVCAAAEGCPGTADACIDNCEAKPGCVVSGPILCPGQQTNPSCYQCVGTPTPCADLDDSNVCTDVGCTWGHQACEGTPVACETYDEPADCSAQPGCLWDE
jgi:hypothetical protein